MLMETASTLGQISNSNDAKNNLVDEIRSISCSKHRDIFQFNDAVDFRQQLSHDTINNVASTATMPAITRNDPQLY